MSLWRNRLARSAVNPKVGGSSPPSDEFVLLLFFISIFNTLKNKTHSYYINRVKDAMIILYVQCNLTNKS